MRRAGRLLAAVCALAAPLAVGAGGGAAWAGGSTALIQGSGSSWAANAVNQWVADVASEGIQVVYTPDGDAQGRQDFANHTSDFSVTADGYGQDDGPDSGITDNSHGRSYVYLPIAAGGTAFPYHIVVDGKQVRNLRLSGKTLVDIFTDKITNWDDPAITADNNGVPLPSLPIIPVVQSEGSGATEQLTKYFATEFPQQWSSFNSGSSQPTEYFPTQGDQIAQNGSNAAMNYVASASANGSITYVEYSYALSVNYPVAKVLNADGYYTLPTQYNVAVALEKAVINPTTLLQDLTSVYTDTDARTYPLSSYVYMIEPTSGSDSTMTTAKRQSLVDFEDYAVCQGQKEIGPIGYSPLPVNLVEASFNQIDALHAADPGVDLTNINVDQCNNPTFVEGHPNQNYLAQIAPMPPWCDKTGAGPCAAGVTPNGIGTTPNSSGTYPGVGSKVPSKATGTTATQSSSAGSASAALSSSGNSSAVTSGAGAATATSPTQAVVTTTTIPPPALVSVTLPSFSSKSLWARLAPWVAAGLLIVFAVPVIVGHRRARRRGAEK